MTVDDIKQIAVIGAGLMGHGIAQEFASAGYNVHIHDVTDERLKTACTQIEGNLITLAENAVIQKECIAPTLQRIQTNTELSTVAESADVVVEAVTEDLALKQQIFQKLDGICPPHTILASNTTALMPSQIGLKAKRKDKILNTHYFNPPYLIPLVELIRSPETSDETVAVAFDLLTAIGKTPAIIEKEVLGFVGPRLQAALIREAFAIVEQGIASAEPSISSSGTVSDAGSASLVPLRFLNLLAGTSYSPLLKNFIRTSTAPLILIRSSVRWLIPVNSA